MISSRVVAPCLCVALSLTHVVADLYGDTFYRNKSWSVSFLLLQIMEKAYSYLALLRQFHEEDGA